MFISDTFISSFLALLYGQLQTLLLVDVTQLLRSEILTVFRNESIENL